MADKKSSGKGASAQARQAEVRRQMAAAKAAERRSRGLLWGGVAAVVLGLGVLAGVVISNTLAEQEAVDAAAKGDIEGVVENLNQSRDHVQGQPEPQLTAPPSGGNHDPIPQDCGIYTAPVPVWHAVHSLEHGVVWITYSPDLAADQVGTLTTIARANEHTILSPFPGQTSPVVLTAWGTQLAVDSADDSRVKVFVAKYVNGPNAPEPGASCTGGMTATV